MAQSSTEHLSSIGIPFFTFNDCNHSTFSVSVFMSLYWTYACTSWLFSKKQPTSSRSESRGGVGGAVLGALALVFSDLPPLAFSAVLPPALLFSTPTATPNNTTREKPGIGHVANPGCNPGRNRGEGGSTPGMRTRVSNPGIYQGRPISRAFLGFWTMFWTTATVARPATARGDRPGIRPGICACARKSKSYSQPRFTMKA